MPLLSVKHLSDPSKNYTHLVHSLQQTCLSLYPHQAQGMLTLYILLELILCLQQAWSGGCLSIATASWKPIHHVLCQPSLLQLKRSSSPTAGMNEIGATLSQRGFPPWASHQGKWRVQELHATNHTSYLFWSPLGERDDENRCKACLWSWRQQSRNTTKYKA